MLLDGEAKEQGELFDIVVNDPPSMAPSARTRAKAPGLSGSAGKRPREEAEETEGERPVHEGADAPAVCLASLRAQPAVLPLGWLQPGNHGLRAVEPDGVRRAAARRRPVGALCERRGSARYLQVAVQAWRSSLLFARCVYRLRERGRTAFTCIEDEHAEAERQAFDEGPGSRKEASSHPEAPRCAIDASVGTSRAAAPASRSPVAWLIAGSSPLPGPGGLILACSCSSHITSRDLHRAVEAAGPTLAWEGEELPVPAAACSAVGRSGRIRQGLPQCTASATPPPSAARSAVLQEAAQRVGRRFKVEACSPSPARCICYALLRLLLLLPLLLYFYCFCLLLLRQLAPLVCSGTSMCAKTIVCPAKWNCSFNKHY